MSTVEFRKEQIPILQYISFVAYFSKPLDGVLKGIDERCNEMALSVWGKRQARWWYSTNEQPKKSAHERHKQYKGTHSLGTAVDLDRKIWSQIKSFGDYTCPRDSRRFTGIEEDLFGISYDTYAVKSGQRLGPYLLVDFSLCRMNEKQLTGMYDIAVQFGEMIDAIDCLEIGLGDVGTFSETVLGRDYGKSSHSCVLFHRKLMREVWIQSGKNRSKRAQSVFWVNYFTPGFIRKLGGKQFIEEYRSLEDKVNYDLVHIYPSGSVALFLSRRIQEMCDPYIAQLPPTIERATWLYTRLIQKGLLCGQ